MSFCGGGIPLVFLLGQSRGLSAHACRVRAHHQAMRTEQPSLPLPGIPAQDRARQVLSCHDHGPTTGGTAVYFGHLAFWKSPEFLTSEAAQHRMKSPPSSLQAHLSSLYSQNSCAVASGATSWWGAKDDKEIISDAQFIFKLPPPPLGNNELILIKY